MKMGYCSVLSVCCWIMNSWLILFLAWSGIHWYMYPESNRCILTRMMEYPEYEKIDVDYYGRNCLGYGLYRYQEGLYNLPVLFVTGSKGSFKTVRSLATTIYDLVQYNSPFDYYTVDLNEEQSALNGEIIERQTDFVDKAISTILGIYVILPNPPEHIVLIGHSVGSVVILNLLSTRWSLNQTKVKLVISLAGPLYQPVILPDRSMAQIHYRAHNYLNQISMISNYPLVIISITGGSRDRIVPDILGYIDLAYPGLNSLSLFTSSIQNLSTDPTNRLNVFRNLFITKPLLTNHTLHSKRDETPEFNLKSSQLISPHMLWIHKTNQGNSIMDFYVVSNNWLHFDYMVPITSPYITRLPNPITRTFIGAGLITLSMIQKLPIFSSLVLNFQDTKDLKLYLVVSSDTNSLWDSITILIDTFHNVNQRIHSNLPNHPSLLPFYEKNPVTIFNPNLTGIFHRFYLPPEFYYLSPSTISPSLLLIRLHFMHFGGLLCGHLLLSLILLTLRLIAPNENHSLCNSNLNSISIIHEIHYHLGIAFIHFLKLILGHLPFLIISLPWGFIVPILNCIFDNGFLFLSRIIHRNDCSIIKQNDNLSSSSTLFMNISTLCILSVGWILSESVAVLLLSLLLLINRRQQQQQYEQNSIIQLTMKHNKQLTNQHDIQCQMKYYLTLFYLIKWRIVILLSMISVFMLSDWISLIERIKQFDFSISSLCYHHSSLLQFNHFNKKILISISLFACLFFFFFNNKHYLHCQNRKVDL
ncbi:GPI inositol-deacylase [Schistosoma japonicum]|nr:GPI inositol-deacylase [Schistosoma japonicum]